MTKKSQFLLLNFLINKKIFSSMRVIKIKINSIN